MHAMRCTIFAATTTTDHRLNPSGAMIVSLPRCFTIHPSKPDVVAGVAAVAESTDLSSSPPSFLSTADADADADDKCLAAAPLRADNGFHRTSPTEGRVHAFEMVAR